MEDVMKKKSICGNSITKLREYLEDPFLNMMYQDIKKHGKIKASLVDITNQCNLRCKGCYFFEDGMDRSKPDYFSIDQFIRQEKERGTNYFTVLGGEPALALHRLKKIYDNFKIGVGSNGLVRIPYKGFENMVIAISVWGDHETDTCLRGGGKLDVFAKGLANYKNDPRVTWYYTVMSGTEHEIESVTDQCVGNGNSVLYNFYGDISRMGGKFDHQSGFENVRRILKKMIRKYPDRIYNTDYFNEVVSSGRLCGMKWGYDVCSSVTFDHEENRDRIRNGNFYNKHFRAYNADLASTRRCCVGIQRDCGNCYDAWAHFSWIIGNMRKHLNSKTEFTNWLATSYVFFLANHIVDYHDRIRYLPDIHRLLDDSEDEFPEHRAAA